MDFLFPIILQIVLIGLNAIFACAEIAVISMNEAKISSLIAKGGKDAKKAKTLSKLTEDPSKFLSTIQVAITLAGFLGSAFAADMFAEPLVEAILSISEKIPEAVISPICVILITLILAFFNIVFGELVPKRIAMNKSEAVAKALAGILSFVSSIFKPVVFLLTASTNAVLKIFGISPDDKGENVTEDDIIMMAEAGLESGSIECNESELIKNIFQFNDLLIGEICTHRKDIDALYIEDSTEEWAETIYSTLHTYYPVFGDSSDDIKGVLFAKTYFRLDDRSKENIIQNALQKPIFVYENTPANKVFENMKKTKEYFALVVDEYGGITGIVSIHDLLELIVGDMTDKGDEEEYTIEAIGEGAFRINGIAPFYKVEDALGITINTPGGEEYKTFGGYVFDIMQDSEFEDTAETEQMTVKILEIEKQCITKVEIHLKAQE